MLQLISYVGLGRRNCIAAGVLREQTLAVREERGLPGLRTGQSEHRLSPVHAQDGLTGEERGPQGCQRPERGLPHAPLELADKVVQETDEAQRRLGPPAKRREQNPSAPKACLSSLMRFSLPARTRVTCTRPTSSASASARKAVAPRAEAVLPLRSQTWAMHRASANMANNG